MHIHKEREGESLKDSTLTNKFIFNKSFFQLHGENFKKGKVFADDYLLKAYKF
jgi:hypothetical protein